MRSLHLKKDTILAASQSATVNLTWLSTDGKKGSVFRKQRKSVYKRVVSNGIEKNDDELKFIANNPCPYLLRASLPLTFPFFHTRTPFEREAVRTVSNVATNGRKSKPRKQCGVCA
jgi:hypothetical protein